MSDEINFDQIPVDYTEDNIQHPEDMEPHAIGYVHWPFG